MRLSTYVLSILIGLFTVAELNFKHSGQPEDNRASEESPLLR